jgi:hypothetical protein
MSFKVLTNSILEGIIKELNKKETKDKINKEIISPLANDIAEKYYPHLMSVIVVLVFVVLMLITLLILAILQRCSINDKSSYSCN